MSDDDSSSGVSGGVCFLPLAIFLVLLFLVLKVSGVIDWCWLAILSPILAWLGLQLLCCAMGILIVVIVFLVIIFAGVIEWMLKKKYKL